MAAASEAGERPLPALERRSPLVGAYYLTLGAAWTLYWQGHIGFLLSVAVWAAAMAAIVAQRAYVHGVLRLPRPVEAVVQAAAAAAGRAASAASAVDEWIFPVCVMGLVAVLTAMARGPHAATTPVLPLADANELLARLGPPQNAAEARLLGLPHWHLECRRLPFRWRTERAAPCLAPPTLCVLVDVASGDAVREPMDTLQQMADASGPRSLDARVALAAELGKPWAAAQGRWPALLTVGSDVGVAPSDRLSPSPSVFSNVRAVGREYFAAAVVHVNWAVAAKALAASSVATDADGHWMKGAIS